MNFMQKQYKKNADKMTVNVNDDVLEALASFGYPDPQAAVEARVSDYMRRGTSPTGVWQLWLTRDPWDGEMPTPADWATCVVVDVHWDVQDETMRTVTVWKFKHQPQDR